MAERLLPHSGAAPSATAAEGCERALQSIYRRRSQEMFGFARRLGLGDEEASDAVQEAMLRLWRELDSGARIDDPDAWVFRTLYRLAMDGHRLRRRLADIADRLSLGHSSAPAIGGGEIGERLEVDEVWQAIDRLPARQRAVLYLRYRADLPYDGIGLALGITAGAARGHASTGLGTLRRRFGVEVER
jgi:RNA polymerase sigma-70 factor, ECF subfamily